MKSLSKTGYTSFVVGFVCAAGLALLVNQFIIPGPVPEAEKLRNVDMSRIAIATLMSSNRSLEGVHYFLDDTWARSLVNTNQVFEAMLFDPAAGGPGCLATVGADRPGRFSNGRPSTSIDAAIRVGSKVLRHDGCGQLELPRPSLHSVSFWVVPPDPYKNFVDAVTDLRGVHKRILGTRWQRQTENGRPHRRHEKTPDHPQRHDPRRKNVEQNSNRSLILKTVATDTR